MALIKCPECGKQISSKASSCPNCGCPITVTDKRRAEDISAEILPEEKEILEEASKKNIKAAKIGLVFSIILFCIFLVFFIVGIAYRKDSKITVACIVLSIVSFCGFLIATSIFFSKSKVLVYVLADHHGTRIFVFGNGGKPVAYADGYLLEINPTSHNGATAKYEITTPSKEDVGIYYKKGDIFLEYYDVGPSSQGNTIINNIYQETSKDKKLERSDMEKILIKNAKIDALASIDPTNTEKSKEQIKIVKELDDLD